MLSCVQAETYIITLQTQMCKINKQLTFTHRQLVLMMSVVYEFHINVKRC